MKGPDSSERLSGSLEERLTQTAEPSSWLRCNDRGDPANANKVVQEIRATTGGRIEVVLTDVGVFIAETSETIAGSCGFGKHPWVREFVVKSVTDDELRVVGRIQVAKGYPTIVFKKQ